MAGLCENVMNLRISEKENIPSSAEYSYVSTAQGVEVINTDSLICCRKVHVFTVLAHKIKIPLCFMQI
jgi:hypothetical protein